MIHAYNATYIDMYLHIYKNKRYTCILTYKNSINIAVQLFLLNRFIRETVELSYVWLNPPVSSGFSDFVLYTRIEDHFITECSKTGWQR